MKCTCEYCSGADYDSSDFFIDLTANLSKERPIGVSGLLRVKNDEDFLSACIDSCIGPLDELIIVCQPSDDRTQQIVETKRRQYPDKIRAYFYRPRVLSHNLSVEELEYAKKLPSDSIHLLANYYNYTLSKASYRYAVKIDADQIYFPEKLQRICDAYRNEQKEHGRFSDAAVSYALQTYNQDL